MICAYCGDDHSWFYCRKKPVGWKPPTKSTAVGKDRRQEAELETASDPRGSTIPAAGTQAPPVDTKRKPGRPSTGFDKKAYDRQKSAERRAKLKE